MYIFGVDIGGTTVKLGLFDQQGQVLDKWEIPTVTDNGGAQILPDVATSIKEVMAKNNITKDMVIGIGVGAPGPIDADGTIYKAPNLGWDKFNIPQVLGQYMDNIPVKAGNDANVAALGEMWQGGAKGYTNVVMVTLGTGVGGGIIIDGKIVTGSTGAGGEIGHMHVNDDETQLCGCKNKGCLEQYASATGVVRLANMRLEKDDAPSVLRDGEVSAKAIFDAVKAKDAVAIEVAQQFGEYLGKGLAQIAAVVNPEVFVVGGGVSKAGEVLFDFICPVYERTVFYGSRDAKFSLATLGNDAGIYGAAALVL